MVDIKRNVIYDGIMKIRRPISFTEDGYKKIQEEHRILTEQRKNAVELLSIARDMGDRSENGAYTAARSRLNSIDRQLRHLTRLLKEGKIIHTIFNGKADIDTLVTLRKEQETVKYHLVGGYESDLNSNKLSIFSPLGKALIGKQIGETVKILVPAGQQVYTILEIQPSL